MENLSMMGFLERKVEESLKNDNDKIKNYSI